MPEVDMFALIREKFGAPEHAVRVPADEAARYADRVPGALIDFWTEHGRGAYEQGKFWICDPEPFEPVIDAVFRDDPELDPADLTTVGYSAFGTLKLWHRQRRAVNVDFLFLTVFNPPASSWHDKNGRPFSADFSISCHLTEFQYGPTQVDIAGKDLLPQAIARAGRLAPGELYGFLPALHLGGLWRVDNLRRMDAVEHLLVIAETANFTLTAVTPPQPPSHPYGRVVPVRPVGVRG